MSKEKDTSNPQFGSMDDKNKQNPANKSGQGDAEKRSFSQERDAEAARKAAQGGQPGQSGQAGHSGQPGQASHSGQPGQAGQQGQPGQAGRGGQGDQGQKR